jgi:hypothetical protein
MHRHEDRLLNYKDFSEIDYFFSSNLADSAWGIDRLLQRVVLFDPLKRHIPYILLIHIIFYNPDLKLPQKKEILNKLISELYKYVIKKAVNNPLNDFIPSYYVMSLLIDLHISGYNVKPLILNLKIDPVENPLISVKKYGDYSIEGFPEALAFFSEKLVFYRDARSKLLDIFHKESNYNSFLSEIAQFAVLANNLSGYNHIFKKIKDKESKSNAQLFAANVHAERKEISEAIRIAESTADLREKWFIYRDISFQLLEKDQIEVVLEMYRNTTFPEIKSVMVANTVNHYIQKQIIGKAMHKLEEAYDLNKLIKDNFYETINFCYLFDFEFRLGRKPDALKNLERAIFNITNILKPPDDKFAFDFLIYRLAINNQFDKVNELMQNKYSNPDQFDDWERIYQTYKVYQIIIDSILRIIDSRIRARKQQTRINQSMMQIDYYETAKTLAEMIPVFNYQEETFLKIALHYAKHGFYNEAKELLPKISEESYRQKLEMECPIYAVINGDIEESINLANSITNNKLRTEILLAMSPHLAKQNHYKKSLEFMREWAVYCFQNE